MIPTGWTSVDEDKTYPAISTRAPQPMNADDESNSGYGFNDRNGSESSEGEGSNQDGEFLSSRMVDESDEDEDPPRFSKVSLIIIYHRFPLGQASSGFDLLLILDF